MFSLPNLGKAHRTSRIKTTARGFSYILVDKLLALLEGSLPEMRRYLGSRVVHELAVLPKHVLRPCLLLLLLLRVRAAAIAAMLRGLRTCWRRWRSELRNRRHMLGDRVVKRGRLPVGLWSLHFRDSTIRLSGGSRAQT